MKQLAKSGQNCKKVASDNRKINGYISYNFLRGRNNLVSDTGMKEYFNQAIFEIKV